MDYDLCIIGAGWAGFNAGLNAARLGKRVCVIEEKEIGGTCLNRGCIPTKALLNYSKHVLSLPELHRKKNDVVLRLRTGMSFLFKSFNIDYFQGKAKIESSDCVSVNNSKKFKSKFILIATGSQPQDLVQLKIDHRRVVSSDDVLDLEHLPKKILIVGGGVIGCEFATLFNRLGAEVAIVEIMPQLLPGFDAQVSKKLLQSFQKARIAVHLGKSIEEFKNQDYDKILLAVGRRPVIEGLWEDSLGIRLQNGSILVDEHLRTSVANVFAAGDCIGGHMLAHVASYEGELAVENMFLRACARDYSVVPCSVFTTPEVASIGLSEEGAKKSNVSYRTTVVHYLAVGMAHVLEDTQGFVKVIVEEKTGRILGASIIGLYATELINTFSVFMKNNISITSVKKTIFAHPSISEIIAETAKAFDYE